LEYFIANKSIFKTSVDLDGWNHQVNKLLAKLSLAQKEEEMWTYGLIPNQILSKVNNKNPKTKTKTFDLL
jgi:hypothetical protein